MKLIIFLMIWSMTRQIDSVLPVTKVSDTGRNISFGPLRPKVIETHSGSDEDTTPKRSTVHYYHPMYCEQELYQLLYIDEHNKSQMLPVTWNRTKAGENAVLPNLCSAQNGLPLRRRCLLPNHSQLAVWESYDYQTTMIQCRLSMFCETEKFEHYLIEDDELQRHVNSWRRTRINQKSTLQEVCLQNNGLPLTRQCYYNSKTQRATWENVTQYKDFRCIRTTEQQIISNDLNLLLINVSDTSRSFDVRNRRTACNQLLTLLESPKQLLLPADIHTTNEILKGIVADTQDTELSSNVLQITHSLMASDPSVLRLSADLNATNSLLETFETYMDTIGDKFVPQNRCNIQPKIPLNAGGDNNGTLSVEVLNFMHIGVYAHVSGNISVFFINPDCANISGVAIYPSKLTSTKSPHARAINYDSFNDFHYRFILMNESANALLNETDLELATFVPWSMWQQLSEHFKLLERSPLIVVKVYSHDALFVETNTLRTQKPFSKILSISMPGYEDILPENLPFILRQNVAAHTKSLPNINNGCGYWNYSTWTSSGVQTSNASHGSLMLCYTNHLTQFSYLIGGNFKQNNFTDEILITSAHQEALDIISLVGCTLSLMGLLGIWITALLFKSWRVHASNKILLNMCVALTLQMVLFLFVNTDDVSEMLVHERNYTKCVILGALLQYSILVLFTWMLLIAFLQFQRYVTVIGIQRPKHYIAKSAIVAWGLPLIPTLCVACIDPHSYIPSTYQLVSDTGICYPSGSALHFGVILPIGVIILANFSIFIYVFYSISRTLKMSIQHNEKKFVLKQIRLSILLFFLLGLSWIFGIFAFMKAGIVFSYLFCLTATMQGFVLFVYFVILDENTRHAWLDLLCPNRSKKAQRKVTELQSMTTTSTSNGHSISNVH